MISKEYSLKDETSWKIGGVADWAALPKTMDEVIAACEWARSQKLPITVLSGGSNVLISDKGVEGLVLILKNLSGLENINFKNQTLQLSALAGTPKSELLKIFVKYRLAPAVFMAGLPGDVGGGVVMNAGISHDVSPKEFVEIVDWVEVLRLDANRLVTEGSIVRLQKNHMQWKYRKCEGWQPGIIVRVGISWSGPSDENVLKILQESNRRRMSTQPLSEPSCGSVFKNPPNNKSGRLIEECGLKGFRIGGAQVSEKHANFIVNKGGATAQDVETLRQHIQAVVKEKTGVLLEPEYIFIGRN